MGPSLEPLLGPSLVQLINCFKPTRNVGGAIWGVSNHHPPARAWQLAATILGKTARTRKTTRTRGWSSWRGATAGSPGARGWQSPLARPAVPPQALLCAGALVLQLAGAPVACATATSTCMPPRCMQIAKPTFAPIDALNTHKTKALCFSVNIFSKLRLRQRPCLLTQANAMRWVLRI